MGIARYRADDGLPAGTTGRSLGEGHRVIHGVAGSGKTMILGYRCLHLAKVLHKPILVLCFNITLAARLRSFIAEKGIEEKVQPDRLCVPPELVEDVICHVSKSFLGEGLCPPPQTPPI